MKYMAGGGGEGGGAVSLSVSVPEGSVCDHVCVYLLSLADHITIHMP